MKTIIIAIWKNKPNEDPNKVESFSTLPLFLEKYPGRNYQTIMHWISRKGEPYQDEEVIINRVQLQKKTASDIKKASIIPEAFRFSN